MADFTVAAQTDFIGTIIFGSKNDRWRLDDFKLTSQLKRPDEDDELVSMTLANGRLVITDPITRKLEIHIPWQEIAALTGDLFEFDIVFENRTTGRRDRSEIYTLAVTRGVTRVEE